MFSLKVKNREAGTKLESLKETGEIPAVYYGAKEKNTPISVSFIDFKKVWRDAGESTPVVLETSGGKVNVLIHDVQLHPVMNEPTHVDFLVVDMAKKVEVAVPLEFTGVAPAVKGGLGTLVKVMHEVQIEALPNDLPQSIEVDISSLVDLESQLTVADVKMPAGVTAVTNAAEIVVAIAAAQEESEESSEPVDLSSIEVEKKGKKEDPEEAA